MSELNKSVLQQANAAVQAGDNEGFLSFCTEDVVWSTVGGETLHGSGWRLRRGAGRHHVEGCGRTAGAECLLRRMAPA